MSGVDATIDGLAYKTRPFPTVGMEMVVVGAILTLIILGLTLVYSRGEYPNVADKSFWPMILVSFVSGVIFHAAFEYTSGNHKYCQMYMKQQAALQ